jgi:hypothetical protein
LIKYNLKEENIAKKICPGLIVFLFSLVTYTSFTSAAMELAHKLKVSGDIRA